MDYSCCMPVDVAPNPPKAECTVDFATGTWSTFAPSSIDGRPVMEWSGGADLDGFWGEVVVDWWCRRSASSASLSFVCQLVTLTMLIWAENDVPAAVLRRRVFAQSVVRACLTENSTKMTLTGRSAYLCSGYPSLSSSINLEGFSLTNRRLPMPPYPPADHQSTNDLLLQG
jgi:hypothetical protein